MSTLGREKFVGGTVEVAASSGITFATGGSGAVSVQEIGEGLVRKTILTVPEFSFTIAGAAKAVGQKIYTFPEGFVVPLGATIDMVSTTAGAGATGTAGEVGLGSTIGSGANATLGAVAAAAENIMEGTTISNHVVGTALASLKANSGVAAFDHGAAVAWPLDGSSTAVPLHLNIASTWGAAGTCTVNSAVVTIAWLHLGDS